MRRADKVINEVVETLQCYRGVVGRSRHGTISWHVQDNGLVNVEFKPTLRRQKQKQQQSA
jgi:hypothetical protein